MKRLRIMPVKTPSPIPSYNDADRLAAPELTERLSIWSWNEDTQKWEHLQGTNKETRERDLEKVKEEAEQGAQFLVVPKKPFKSPEEMKEDRENETTKSSV